MQRGRLRAPVVTVLAGESQHSAIILRLADMLQSIVVTGGLV